MDEMFLLIGFLEVIERAEPEGFGRGLQGGVASQENEMGSGRKFGGRFQEIQPGPVAELEVAEDDVWRLIREHGASLRQAFDRQDINATEP